MSAKVIADPVLFYEANKLHGIFSNYYTLSQPLMFDGKSFASSEHMYQWFKFVCENEQQGDTQDGVDSKQNDATKEYAELVRTANTPNKARVLAMMKRGGGYKWRTDLNKVIDEYKDRGVSLREDWDKIKLDIMLRVLRVKFSQNKEAHDALIATGDALLVEHSFRDAFWGDGCVKGSASIGSGANHLGKLLARVRDELNAKTLKPKFDSAAPKAKRRRTK